MHKTRWYAEDLRDGRAQEYIDFIDGIRGQSDEGLYAAVPYRPEGFIALGDGSYRRSPAPRH
jgi:hypothetical protein